MNPAAKVAARAAVQHRMREEAEMGRVRKASRKQIEYIEKLETQLPGGEAARISRATLSDPLGSPVNVFSPCGFQPRSFSRERLVDHISSDDATKLISALLDKVGRKGRRRNNRGTR